MATWVGYCIVPEYVIHRVRGISSLAQKCLDSSVSKFLLSFLQFSSAQPLSHVQLFATP